MDAALRKEFKRKCRQEKLTAAEERNMEAVFAENEHLPSLSDAFLLRCQHFPLRWVQVNALYQLFQRNAAQFPNFQIEDATRLSFAGLFSWPTEELIRIMQDLGYTVVEAGANTDCLVLGLEAGEVDLELLHRVPVLPLDKILPILLQGADFFLLKGNREQELGNIRQMMLSGQSDSSRLGIQMLLQAGLPPQYATEVFALWRSKQSHDIRMTARQALLRYTTGPFKKNLLRQFLSFYTSDRQLIGLDQQVYDPEGWIDLKRYLKLNFHLNPHVPFNADVLVSYHQGLRDLPKEEAREILQLLVQSGRLRLTPATRTVPEVLYEIKGLRSLELVNESLESLPDGISQMDSLLRFQVDGCLSSLPADFAQCKMIRWIWLRDNRFPAFPAQLLQVRHLKYFSWINGLADPETTLVLPAEIAEVKLQSLHVEEARIDFPDSFFQHPTLTSLNISLSAMLPYLERIPKIPQLQRLQIHFPEDAQPDHERIHQALVGWRLEDKKVNNLSYVRR